MLTELNDETLANIFSYCSLETVVTSCSLLNKRIAAVTTRDNIWMIFHKEYCDSLPLVDPIHLQVMSYIKKTEYAYFEFKKEVNARASMAEHGLVDSGKKKFQLKMSATYNGDWDILYAASSSKSTKLKRKFETRLVMNREELRAFKKSLKLIVSAPAVRARCPVNVIYRNRRHQDIEVDIIKSVAFLEHLTQFFAGRDRRVKDAIDRIMRTDRKSCVVC